MYVNTLIVVTLGVFAGVCNVDGIPSDYLSLLKQPEKLEERNDIKSAIIRGKEVRDGEIPYQVYLITTVNNEGYGCGGSVLNSKWILTAAHCVVRNGRAVHESQVVVFAGSADLKKTRHRRNVRQVVVNSKYNPNTYPSKSDIALLKLTDSLPIDKHFVAAVTLPQKNYPAGTACTVSGWGRSEYTDYPKQLRTLRTYTTTFEKCLQMWTSDNVDSSNLCSNNEIGTGICDGDSGGPLVVFENKIPVQIGIVSSGTEDCAVVSSDIYVNVRNFIGFINENIKNMS